MVRNRSDYSYPVIVSNLSVLCQLPQSCHVEDEHHPLVAQLGRACYACDLHQGVADATYDYFTLPEDAVNSYAERACSAPDHKDMKSALTLLFKCKESRQAHER